MYISCLLSERCWKRIRMRIKFIDDFFINRKKNSLPNKNKVHNVKKQMESPSIIVVHTGSSLKQALESGTLHSTLKKRYSKSDIYLLVPAYEKLYNEIISENIIKVSEPMPTKFRELEIYKRVHRKLKNTDIYFDLSDYDPRIKIIVKRVFNPQFAVSTYNESLKDDYNILVKSSGSFRDMLNMTGFEISEDKSFFDDVRELAHSRSALPVLIGNSRHIDSTAKQFNKQSKNFIRIKSPEKTLTKTLIADIIKSDNVIASRQYRSDIDYLKKQKA